MQLIIIRGPLGSGKSSVAQELHNTATQKTALLPLDIFRASIAKEQENAPQITAEIIEHAAKKFLDAGYAVILEGVFNFDRPYYKELFNNLLEHNQNDNHLYFLEISLDESIKRNANRSKGSAITEDKIRELYSKAQKTGYKLEKVIDVEEKASKDVVGSIAEECGLSLDANNYKKHPAFDFWD